MLGQYPPKEAVHATDRIRDRHRRKGVAVVSAADGEKARAWLAVGDMPLQRHLHGDLDGDRARVGEEDVIQALGGELDQAAPEFDRRFVGEPAEHHVAHAFELIASSAIELGHGIPVDGAPPRAHGVDGLKALTLAVTEVESNPLGALDEVGILRAEGAGVGVPEVRAVEGQQPPMIGKIRRGGHGTILAGPVLRGMPSAPSRQRRAVCDPQWAKTADSATSAPTTAPTSARASGLVSSPPEKCS